MVYPESDLGDDTSNWLGQEDSFLKKHLDITSPMSTPRRQTYKALRKSKNLLSQVPERIGKHYSSVIRQDQWDLNESDAVLQVIFTEEMRRKKRKQIAFWLLITFILFVYISFLLAFFWKQWTTDCIRQLSVWLAVYEGIIVL